MKYMVLYFCQIFGLFLSNPLSGLAWPFVLPFPWHCVSWCVLNSHQPGQEVWCGPDLTMVGCKQFLKSWDFASTVEINLPWHTSAAPQRCKNVNNLFGFLWEVKSVLSGLSLWWFSFPTLFSVAMIPGKNLFFFLCSPLLLSLESGKIVYSGAEP